MNSGAIVMNKFWGLQLRYALPLRSFECRFVIRSNELLESWKNIDYLEK